MKKRKKFDINAPNAQALRNEIVHGTFMTEGTLVAFPLCFPGTTEPIAADESRITALDVSHDWMVYGGTSGHTAHLFVGMLHGATGMVLDMGVVEGATECVAVCCGAESFVGFVNGPAGGRAIMRKLQPLPFDLLQEWGFAREPYTDLGPIVEGEAIVHAAPLGDHVVGTTDGHLFTLSLVDGKVDVVCELRGRGRLAAGREGGVYGLGDSEVWRYRVGDCGAEPVAPLPEGSWDTFSWARGALYIADAEGRLFEFTERDGFSDCLGQTRLAPVGPMAVTPDGRIFGWCGEGIARMFCYSPDTGEVADLGSGVSVIQRRRYGYQFGDAVVGRDGQLIFGEDDDLGHLWIYFPRILPRSRG